MTHEPRKNPLDFGGIPDHVTLKYRLCRINVTVRWSGAERHQATLGLFTRRFV